MTTLTLRNASLLLLIVLLSILLVVSMLFYMKYNDENATNQKLLTVPRYEWREYIDYLKEEIEVYILSTLITLTLYLFIITTVML